jgi:predicted GH43/DUF377 family glycosyl hydrolase
MVMKLRKFKKNPIISPNPDNQWENLATFNPAAWYENGRFYLLYRASGDDDDYVVRLGLAVSEDGYNFTRETEPVFCPSENGYDSGCVEDPRIVKFGEIFYVTYAYRPFPPGQYWKFPHDVVKVPEVDEFTPAAIKRNLGNSALASTKDFREWRRLGRLTSPTLDDRDVILFPEKIGGKYVMMHRPKEYVGEMWGPEYPAIWIKFSDDILQWEDKPSHLLIEGRPGGWEEKIGGSSPPLRTDKGWLVLYHGVESGGFGYYRVGALLLDIENPLRILARTSEPILEPEFDYEINGYYKGCVFPCGNVIAGDTLYVYYGAADKYVGVATCPIKELMEYLLHGE